MLSFIFYCIKNTEICLIFEGQNVTFLQYLQSPVHCFKTVIIFISKILLESCTTSFILHYYYDQQICKKYVTHVNTKWLVFKVSLAMK